MIYLIAFILYIIGLVLMVYFVEKQSMYLFLKHNPDKTLDDYYFGYDSVYYGGRTYPEYEKKNTNDETEFNFLYLFFLYPIFLPIYILGFLLRNTLYDLGENIEDQAKSKHERNK